eukprot:m.14818 g.14818  ORF g.14818 m.14818 type:complete len:281 (+) comp10537_c0_seq1:153-995(+)
MTSCSIPKSYLAIAPCYALTVPANLFHHFYPLRACKHFGNSVNDGVLDIRLIFSRNGTEFAYLGGHRGSFVPRGHGIPGSSASLVDGVEINGVPSAWDAGLVYMYRGLLDVGDGNLVLHYFGQQGTHARQDGSDRGKFGIGRVTLLKDRFVSFGSDTPTLDTSTGNGSRVLQAKTTPVVLPSGPCVSLVLSLNADVSVGGRVTVQLLDATTGQPIQPFTHANHVGLTGNTLTQVSKWGNNGTLHTNLQALAAANTAVHLEFNFSPPAQLFAWEFVCGARQ